MFSLYCEEAQTPGQFKTDLRRIITQGRCSACCLLVCLCVCAACWKNLRSGRGKPMLLMHCCTGTVLLYCCCTAAKAKIKDVEFSRVMEADIVDSSGTAGGRDCVVGWRLVAPLGETAAEERA